MKTPVRVGLLLLTGLCLTGCATKTASREETPKTPAIALGDKPLTAQAYWFLRDIEDRMERAREPRAASR